MTRRCSFRRLSFLSAPNFRFQFSTFRFLVATLFATSIVGAVTVRAGSFVETYDGGQDVGIWAASFSVPREIEPTGGSPRGRGIPNGPYLQQTNFGSAIPTWSTASTRFQPGFDDEFKQDSVFVGDWLGTGVTQFTVDLNVIQAGSWPHPGRPLTMQLLQMDQTGFNVKYVATYTTALIRNAPSGWHRYSFPIANASGQMPAGWVFTHGDGTPARRKDWGKLLSRIDVTSVGYYAPGFAYPSLGSWTLGIDNIRLTTRGANNAADDEEDETLHDD